MGTHAHVCCGCWRIADTDNGHYLCSETGPMPPHCSPDHGRVEIAKDKVRNVLWQIFSQSIIYENRMFDNCRLGNQTNGPKPVFDFDIPEHRLLIDVVLRYQWLPPKINGVDPTDDDMDARTKRIVYEDTKSVFASENNYRHLILYTGDLDESMADIRNRILSTLNKVYVKDVPGKVQVLTPRLQGDVGWDLVCDDTVTCMPGVGVDVPTQVFLEMPNHLYAVVQARSSTSKRKLIVLPGVIDPSYRGQIFTMVFNPTAEPAIIKKGERISQLLFFNRVPHLHMDPVQNLMQSERGSNGFGSTS